MYVVLQAMIHSHIYRDLFLYIYTYALTKAPFFVVRVGLPPLPPPSPPSALRTRSSYFDKFTYWKFGSVGESGLEPTTHPPFRDLWNLSKQTCRLFSQTDNSRRTRLVVASNYDLDAPINAGAPHMYFRFFWLSLWSVSVYIYKYIYMVTPPPKNHIFKKTTIKPMKNQYIPAIQNRFISMRLQSSLSDWFSIAKQALEPQATFISDLIHFQLRSNQIMSSWAPGWIHIKFDELSIKNQSNNEL